MTIDAAFTRLRAEIEALKETLDALSTTVEQDRPQHREVAVADHLSDAVLAARGVLEEVAEAAAGGPAALARAHAAYLRHGEQFGREVASFARTADLLGLARERGREWAGWVGVVGQELEHCSAQSGAVAEALLACWQELLEQGTHVAVHNTSIGQQFSLAARPARPQDIERRA